MPVSTETLQQLLATWGYLAVFILVFVESCGIPLPGETMLVTAAVYAGTTGRLRIELVIATAILAAITGDNTGYFIGRIGGRRLALRFGRYVRLDERRLDRAERFYLRHGNKTVFLGRYMAILRAWTAFLAGLNRMPWGVFVLFDAAAGISWSIIYGILGFVLGRHLSLLHRILQAMGIAGLVVGLGVVVVVIVLYRRAHELEEHWEDGEEPPEAASGR